MAEADEERPVTRRFLRGVMRHLGVAAGKLLAQKTDSLAQRMSALERRCAVMERALSGGERSVGAVQSEQLEEVLETLRMPVQPVYDKSGRMIGGKRVAKLPVETP